MDSSSRQLQLPLPRTWGGARVGAGRKPRVPSRPNVSHAVRSEHHQSHPLHVVLRSRVRSLRHPFLFPCIRRALAAATRARFDFRIVQFSVQADHLHLIIEADSKSALSRGMQGLAVRVAKSINRLIFRRGAVFADRYFARALTSPRAVKNAIGYVLNNFRKHGERIAGRADPCSSASFTASGVAPPSRASNAPCPNPISPPRTWLARTWSALAVH